MTAPRIMVTHPWAERRTRVVLKTMAKTRFSLITRRTLRESRIAVGIFSSSSVHLCGEEAGEMFYGALDVQGAIRAVDVFDIDDDL
jgi:hypothetical protein